jgi:uncharacterized protein YqhQ
MHIFSTEARREAKQTARPFNYGGQAVIEGVMMRGSKRYAVAVRNPAGEIVIQTEPLDQRIYGSRIAKLPFLRGLTLLWDALGLGIKSLLFSADVALQEEEKADAGKKEAELPTGLIVAFSLSLSILLFFVLPAFVAGLLERWLGLEGSAIAGNLLEGLIRLGLLVGYIWLIGRMEDVKRLFGYHGAEHKTINAYEAGAALTPESVARFPLEHPRCGTAFLLTVVVISILLYTLLPPLGLGLRIVSRLLLLPLIAGIAYEFIRFTAAHQDNALIRLITRPNLALQRLTTREPDLEMLAVSIAAFEQVLEAEVSQPAPVVAPAMD